MSVLSLCVNIGTPQKVLKNWPKLDERGTTEFHYHSMPNDSPTSYLLWKFTVLKLFVIMNLWHLGLPMHYL